MNKCIYKRVFENKYSQVHKCVKILLVKESGWNDDSLGMGAWANAIKLTMAGT